MKYFCKVCGTEVKWRDKSTVPSCPYCNTYHKDPMSEIPIYETVKQWEARRGERYPDSAPVYVYVDIDTDIDINYWYLRSKAQANQDGWKLVVVATEAGEPPDDWRP